MATPVNEPPMTAPAVNEKTGRPIEKSMSNKLGQSVAIDSYTPEEERRVVRKIDCVVLPMVCLLQTITMRIALIQVRCALSSSSNTSTNKV